jgi:hypothetical protein
MEPGCDLRSERCGLRLEMVRFGVGKWCDLGLENGPGELKIWCFWVGLEAINGPSVGFGVGNGTIWGREWCDLRLEMVRFGVGNGEIWGRKRCDLGLENGGKRGGKMDPGS